MPHAFLGPVAPPPPPPYNSMLQQLSVHSTVTSYGPPPDYITLRVRVIGGGGGGWTVTGDCGS